jgi:hypothetical protein
MRNLAVLTVSPVLASLAALALAGCSLGDIKVGTTNFRGQPLSAVITRLGNPEEQQIVGGLKTYTWIRGTAVQQCRIRVVMAGDVIDTYEGFGDAGTCSQYSATSGGLLGYYDR